MRSVVCLHRDFCSDSTTLWQRVLCQQAGRMPDHSGLPANSNRFPKSVMEP